jgi:SAM-dependent methyltransferase
MAGTGEAGMRSGPYKGARTQEEPVSTITHDPVREGAWSAIFAGLYDTLLARAERRGLRMLRRELVAVARGSTLEIGAGTGLTLEHYSGSVDRLVLTEPSPRMVRRLRKRVARGGRQAEVVEASAEQLPFVDGSFDTVVSALVLCSVDKPALALAEVRRVLRPGGRLLFLEHVRSRSWRLALWQDRLERPWRAFADGCRCNRDTEALLEAAGFRLELHSRGALRGLGPLIRPLVVGSAVRVQS